MKKLPFFFLLERKSQRIASSIDGKIYMGLRATILVAFFFFSFLHVCV